MAIKSKLSEQQARVGQFFKWLPLHPNDITLLSVLLAALGAWFIFPQNLPGSFPLILLGPFLFLLSFLVDGLDGAVARAKNLVSPFGAYLDGVCDRIVEFFALLPLLFSSAPGLLSSIPASASLSTPLLSGLFLPSLLTLFFGSCMTAFSKAYADHREAVEHSKAAKLVTLLPRTERVIGLWVCLILFIYSRFDVLVPLMWVLAAGSVLSFVWLQYGVWRAGGKNGEKQMS